MFSISFMKNQLVNDEDINAIGYNLSNTVYTTFTNDTLYGVDALNEITAHMMNKGVKRNYKNECALSLVDTNIHIDSGLAFYENGATITIDDDGIDLTLEDSAETQYVYLFFNDTINVGGARCTVEYPSGDFVLLGSITDGVLTQERTFAYLNADAKGTNEVVTLTLEGSAYYPTENGHHWVKYKTGINVAGFTRVCFYTPKDEFVFSEVESGSGSATKGAWVGAFDIPNNSMLYVGYYHYYYYGGNRGYDFTSENTAHLKCYIEDGCFVFEFDNVHYHNCNIEDKTLIVELYGGAEE